MRAGLGLVVAGLLVGAGCQSEDVFQCQSDMQCVSSGVEGMCQPSGYCSFADGMCESGFRYGDSAPPGLAGQCVEPEATGSSGPDPTGNTTMLPATTSATGSGSSSGGMASGSSTGSSTGTEGSSEGSAGSDSSSGGSSSSSGGGGCPEFVDEFDNGIVEEDPWVWKPLIPLISEGAGTLRFAIELGASEFDFIEMPGVDISNGFAVAHLVSLPQDDAAQFLLRAFPEGEPGSVEFVLTGSSELTARVNGATIDTVTLGVGTAEVWLEFYFEPGTVLFAYSVDGTDFQFLTSSAIVHDYSTADVSLMGGAYEGTTAPSHVIEVDDFEFCSQPFD